MNNDDENNEFEYDDSSKLNRIVANYGGAIIGAVIALILCFTNLYKILVYIVIIMAGAFGGNYIQKNKIAVKEKLKEFIDRF